MWPNSQQFGHVRMNTGTQVGESCCCLFYFFFFLVVLYFSRVGSVSWWYLLLFSLVLISLLGQMLGVFGRCAMSAGLMHASFSLPTGINASLCRGAREARCLSLLGSGVLWRCLEISQFLCPVEPAAELWRWFPRPCARSGICSAYLVQTPTACIFIADGEISVCLFKWM